MLVFEHFAIVLARSLRQVFLEFVPMHGPSRFLNITYGVPFVVRCIDICSFLLFSDSLVLPRCASTMPYVCYTYICPAHPYGKTGTVGYLPKVCHGYWSVLWPISRVCHGYIICHDSYLEYISCGFRLLRRSCSRNIPCRTCLMGIRGKPSYWIRIRTKQVHIQFYNLAT